MRKLLPVVLVVMCILGCAALQVPQTQEGKYLLARTEFNNMLKDYILYKEMLPLDQQELMSMTFKPYFQKAKLLLDNWAVLLETGGDATDSYQLWLDRKRVLMQLLIENGILEVE